MAVAPEILPATPALVEALPPLGMLCILIVCYGLVHGVDAFARALFGTISGSVGWIPFAGKLLSSPIHKIEQKIVSFLGGLEADIDSAIGHQFHNLSRVLSWAWHTFVDSASLLWNVAKFLSGFTTAEELIRVVRHFNHAVKVAEHEAQVGIRKAEHEARVAARSVAHGVYPRLRAVEHDVSRVIPREIKSARALAREATDGVAKLWQRVRSLEHALGAGAIAAAVTAVLAAVGLDWLGCKDGARRVGRSGCNLWDDLGALLGIAFIGAEIASLDELIGVAQTVTEDVTKGVESLLKV